MTETQMISSNPLHGAAAHPGTVGLPLPGVEVRVADERWPVVPVDEIGHDRKCAARMFAGLLADAGEDERGVHRRRLVHDGRSRMFGGKPDGYLRWSAAPRTSSFPAGSTSTRRRSRSWIDARRASSRSAVIGVPHPDFGEAVAAVVGQSQSRLLRRSGRDRGAQGAARQLQGAQARLLRRRTAAQRDGQGAEERAARSLPDDLHAACNAAGR